jgi:hypothetical protein
MNTIHSNLVKRKALLRILSRMEAALVIVVLFVINLALFLGGQGMGSWFKDSRTVFRRSGLDRAFDWVPNP